MKNKKILTTVIIPGAIVIVLIVSCVWILLQKKSHDNTTTGQAPQPESLVNYSPPTDREKQSGDSVKESVLQDEARRNQSPTQTTDGRRSVTPVISYAGVYGNSVEVGAYVSGIFEDGGTCTLTLKKDSEQKTVSITSEKNANSVDCPVMSISKNSLSVGSWDASVFYGSKAASGTSHIKTIEVK